MRSIDVLDAHGAIQTIHNAAKSGGICAIRASGQSKATCGVLETAQLALEGGSLNTKAVGGVGVIKTAGCVGGDRIWLDLVVAQS